MQTKCFIDNFEIDTETQKSISIKKQVKDIRDFSKSKTSFTKPVTAPFTQKNAEKFGQMFNINERGGWDKESQPSARIEVDGFVVLNGNCRLDSIENDGYHFIFFQQTITLSNIFNDELIKGNEDSSKDVFMSDGTTYTPTRTWLRDNYMKINHPITGSQMLMGAVSYYEPDTMPEGMNDDYFTPSISLPELLNEMFAGKGKTVTFSEDIASYIQKMVIPFNGDYINLCDKWDDVLSFATASNTIGFQPMQDLEGKFLEPLSKNGDKITQVISGGFEQSIILLDRGNYTIRFNASYYKTAQGTGNNYKVLPAFYAYQAGSNSEPKKLKASGNAIELINANQSYTGVFEVKVRVDKQSEVWIVYNDIDLPSGQGQLKSDSTVNVSLDDAFYSGQKSFTKNDILPVNYKKIDLIKDILTMFNAIVEADGDNFKITSWVHYTSTFEIKDWSEKLSSKSIKSHPIAELAKPVTSFKMSGDSEILYGHDYKEQFGVDLGYKSLEKDGGTKTLSFPDCMCDEMIPRLQREDGSYKTVGKARIMFAYVKDGYYSQIPSLWGQDRFTPDSEPIDRSISYYPTFSNKMLEEEQDVDNMVINFENSKTYFDVQGGGAQPSVTGNLFLKFYKGFDEFTRYDMLIECEMNLSARDIEEFSFNDVIYINHKIIGSVLCRVNSIQYFTDRKKMAKVELVTTNPYNVVNRDSSVKPLELIELLEENKDERKEYQSTKNN